MKQQTALSWILLTIGLLFTPPAAAGQDTALSHLIDRALPGDTVTVAAGYYRPGRIVVDKPLHLIADGAVVLDGENEHQILTIRADSVEVRGFVFKNIGVSYVEDRAAVKVDGGHYCLITENRFVDTFFAIYLARSQGCIVENNRISGSGSREAATGNGVHAWYCKEITIRNNRIAGHRDGIYLEFVEEALIEQNESWDNLRYGLHFMFSDRCRYLTNHFHDNEAGVAVMYTDSVEMRANRFEHNWGSASFGLLLKDISDSVIENNVFASNTIGVYAEGVNRVDIQHNIFRENGWAVKMLANSLDNEVVSNNFYANSFDVATNSRSASRSRFSANYWDRYRGYDLDRDGFGDVGYRPVSLFSFIVERHDAAIVLLRSFFIELLNMAERVAPVLTPESLIDPKPRMRPLEIEKIPDQSTTS